LFLMFTTAGYDRESVCWEEYDYAKKVRDGIIEDATYLPVIYEADPEDDWSAVENWRKANPNLGITPKLEFLQEECRRAKESAAYQNTFRRLYLNQWTEQETRWLDMDAWEACAERFDPGDLRGLPCYIGLDLASTTDVAAEALVFPPVADENPLWRVMWRFWVPSEGMKKRVTRDRVPYDVWTREGHIEATEGNIIDYETIKARVLDDCETYQVQEIVYDRWGATQLITQLGSEGLTCVPFGQGFQSMAAPTKEWEKIVVGRQLAHNGNPVARWMMSNCAVRMDPAGNLKPDKSKSSDRIDGIVAAIMGLGRAMVAEPTGSVYDTAEPIFVEAAE